MIVTKQTFYKENLHEKYIFVKVILYCDFPLKAYFVLFFSPWEERKNSSKWNKRSEDKISAQLAVYYGREFCLGTGEQGSG